MTRNSEAQFRRAERPTDRPTEAKGAACRSSQPTVVGPSTGLKVGQSVSGLAVGMVVLGFGVLGFAVGFFEGCHHRGFQDMR